MNKISVDLSELRQIPHRYATVEEAVKAVSELRRVQKPWVVPSGALYPAFPDGPEGSYGLWCYYVYVTDGPRGGSRRVWAIYKAEHDDWYRQLDSAYRKNRFRQVSPTYPSLKAAREAAPEYIQT